MRRVIVLLVVLAALLLSVIPALAQDEVLTIYSGRNESLIGPLLESFSDISGIEIAVLYGGTASLAAQILEEGENSPADIFIAQDAGALGALAKAGLLSELPEALTGLVSDSAFVSPEGLWLGLSGRARVLVYDPDALAEAELALPESILDLTDEAWRGKVGWAPTNGSFQANVTAMRHLLGDEATLAWLEAMIANDVPELPEEYTHRAGRHRRRNRGRPGQSLLSLPLPDGGPDITAQLYWFGAGDPGALVNVAGAAIPLTRWQPGGRRGPDQLHAGRGQPDLVHDEDLGVSGRDGIAPAAELKPLAEIETPDLDLSDLDDLAGTLELIEESGALDQ